MPVAVGGEGRRWLGRVGRGPVLLLLKLEALDRDDEVLQGGRDLLGRERDGRRRRG